MANIKHALELIKEYNIKNSANKGISFEDLIILYLKNEPYYKELYSNIYTYAQWAHKHDLSGSDNGVDLVAEVKGTGEYHAIQCKFCEKLNKKEMDSFFAFSAKNYFSHRILITTTNNFSGPLHETMAGQPNFNIIDIDVLENSVIDFAYYIKYQKLKPPKKYSLKDYQIEARRLAQEHFAKAERGQMQMACGTGKTLTSLKIAEAIANKGKKILFLVPSLALMNQTLREWTQQAAINLQCYAVCSDSDIGKKQRLYEDYIELNISDLAYPATTNAKKLSKELLKNASQDVMQVVFCTYQSIDVIHQAQQQNIGGQNIDAQGIGEFELIICDEAHRTTGQAFNDEAPEDVSRFVRIHDNDYIKAKKRLYMTATPRLYGEQSLAKVKNKDVKLYSMDNPKIYGEAFYILPFARAVGKGVLCDYKVIILEVNEADIIDSLYNLQQFEDGSINVSDAAKIVGCWKALTNDESLTEPLRRAVAFCQVIDNQKTKQKTKQRTAKIGSKQISEQFGLVIEHYQRENPNMEANFATKCELKHVDGTMRGLEKQEKINWLREKFEEKDENVCRILTNVRCLSEGVDVPALDAVLFLSPRASMVEVVQSVGRVMRRPLDESGKSSKDKGYVILPVVVPSNIDAKRALDKNPSYKTVWQVLGALRAHDVRLGADLQKGQLGHKMDRMEIHCYREFKEKVTKLTSVQQAHSQSNIGSAETSNNNNDDNYEQTKFNYIDDLTKKICTKAIKVVGDRKYWEDIATDVKLIVETIIENIQLIIKTDETKANIFAHYLQALKNEINDSINEQEAIELLAQHYVTSPIFDAFFSYDENSKFNFTTHNPIAKALEQVSEALNLDNIQNDYKELNNFYETIAVRAEAAATDSALRERMITELYENFYKNAFPKLTKRLGIVFTPIEVVDFILRMVNDALQIYFGESLASENTTILDPFTGTGTFITRLINMLESADAAVNLYDNRLHANELVLLSYYIASINIELALYEKTKLGMHQLQKPFQGILLTDTFAMYDANQTDFTEQLLQQNHDRRNKQQNANINVIIGNPPYSARQKLANDDNQNIKHPALEKIITDTYAKDSKSTGKSAVYDSYIKAIRWATDRIGKKGIIGFVTNSSLLESASSDGLRKHLAQDFTNLYFINLRGDINKSSSSGKKIEGGNVFVKGSKTGICISILIKDPKAKSTGKIYYYDIGDNLTTRAKLQKLTELQNITDINWLNITPNSNYEWLNQRDSNPKILKKFNSFLAVKENSNKAIFPIVSGVKTNRDAWVYNFSKNDLKNNIQKTIDFYNSELKKYQTASNNFIFDNDGRKISWSADLKKNLARQKYINYNEPNIVITTYRPFTNQHLYYEKLLIARTNQISRIFPKGTEDNKVIVIRSTSSTSDFSLYITNKIPDYHILNTSPCLPLYLYDNNNNDNNNKFAFDNSEKTYAISNEILEKFQANLTIKINQEDLFYYIYGILHSSCYRKTFALLLKKELPRIPFAKNDAEFQTFTVAGRELAELHLSFETGAIYQTAELFLKGKNISLEELKTQPANIFCVEKMNFAKNSITKEKDLSLIHYNNYITIANIPLEAYEYCLGKYSAIEWVMEEQTIKTEKNSGIIKNANNYAIEAMNNPAYPLELLLRVIHISIQTQKIIASLPKLEF